MSNRVTLKDVATHAGVSQTTVSLFLNGSTNVCSAETADRIRAAVSELGYARPRGAAASGTSAEVGAAAVSEAGGGVATLARPTAAPEAIPALPPSPRRLRTLGMALPNTGDLLDPADTTPSRLTDQVWHGASQMAEWEEFCLLSYPARLRETTDIRAFLDGSITGLILNAGYEDPRPALLSESGLPVVVLNRTSDIPEACGSVSAYEADTVELALSHLHGLGHRRIAHYAGPVEPDLVPPASVGPNAPIRHVPSDVAVRRLERFVVWMRQHGGYDPDLVFAEANWRGDHAADALDSWLALPQESRPTAVFCASDSLALRLCEAARERGLSIPGDLSIVGVGDSTEATNNGLTSVVLPGEQIGREAVRLLLRMQDGAAPNPADRRRAVPVTQIATRESTGPAPVN